MVCGLSDEPKLISMPHYRLTKYKHSVLGGEHTAGMHLGECCLISPAGVLVQSATVKSPSAELQSISRDDLWVILRQLKATEREKLLLKLLITCGKRDVIPAAALCTITAIKQCLTAEQKKLLQYVDTTETAQLKGLFQSINALLHGINDHCQCYFDVTDSDFDPSHVSPTKV